MNIGSVSLGMDEKLEKLINSPWLDALRRLEEQTNIAARAFRESEALTAATKLMETTKLSALAFQESELMKAARSISETTRMASLAFRESEAFKSIEQLTETSRMASLALQESEAMKLMRQFSESTKAISLNLESSRLFKEFEAAAKASQFAAIAFQQSEAAKQLANFGKLSSFNALAELANSPFSDSLLVARNLASTAIFDVDEDLADIDSQISDEVNSAKDFNELSEKTKSILSYIYHYYLLPIILSAFTAYIMSNAEEAKVELKSLSTPSEVKSFARSANSKIDRAALRGFRITTARSLNFRKAPSRKSEIFASLPIGSLVEVLDGSNKSWLLVEVEIDGELEQGWIFRRYTTYFK